MLAEVERLPAQAQDVLEALAVAGEQCGHGLLAAVTGIGDRELLGALRLAVSANVLIPDGGRVRVPARADPRGDRRAGAAG